MKPVLTLPRGISTLLRKYSFEAVDTSASLFYSSLEEYREKVLPYHEDVLQLVKRSEPSLGPALYAAELENAEKNLGCWRNIGIGRISPYEVAPVVTDPAFAEFLTPQLKTIGTELCKAARTLPLYALESWASNASHVINKSKGGPTYAPGSHKLAAIPTFVLGRRLATADILDLCGEMMGFELTQLNLRRAQGSRKPGKVGIVKDGAIVSYVEQSGVPKVRSVKASPGIINAQVTRLTELLKNVFRTIYRCNDGDPGPYVQRAREAGYYGATDYSTYDDTIPTEVRDAVRQFVFAPFLSTLEALGVVSAFEVEQALAADEWSASAPVLMPPLDINTAGLIVPRKGTIRSGEKTTSLIGTIVNLAICRACCRVAGIGANEIAVAIQSDDLLFWSRDASVVAAFTGVITSLPFTLKVTKPDYSAFLQRHVPDGFSYFSRQASLNREPVNEWESLTDFGISHAVRYHLLKGHPLRDHFLPTLRKHFPRAADEAEWFCKLSPEALIVALTMSQSGKNFADDEADTIAVKLKSIAPDVTVSRTVLDALSGRQQMTDRQLMQASENDSTPELVKLLKRIKKEVW